MNIGTAKYAMPPSAPYSADQSAAANGAVHTAHQLGRGVENPMVWLVGIGAVTIGLVAFSTNVRVGKFSASVAAG